jgi:hypothetical protein
MRPVDFENRILLREEKVKMGIAKQTHNKDLVNRGMLHLKRLALAKGK